MGEHGLGEFEQAVLLALMRLGDRAYGVSVKRELSGRLGRDVSYGAVYTTLDRLEAKGYVSSRLGETTPERGGRAKRYFRIEAAGEKALQGARARATALWAGVAARGLA